ncbi:MAG: aminotransferase class IV [Hyphomicrobiales bacterium]
MSPVWFNGRIVEGPLPLDPADRGLLLGDGLFETVAVINGKALWLEEHLARLAAAAAELGIAADLVSIRKAIAALPGEAGAHALRVTLTRGPAPRGLASGGESPSLIATLDPLPRGFLMQPVSLATSAVRRNEFAPSSRLKTLSYADAIAAARAAVASGADDALMLNTSGRAASSTIANLFLLKGNELITPDPSQGILPGIMRRALLDLAHHLGLDAVERAVEPEEMASADAVFLSNSLRLIRPVTSLDAKPLGQRPLQAIVDALCARAEAQCGRDPRLL